MGSHNKVKKNRNYNKVEATRTTVEGGKKNCQVEKDGKEKTAGSNTGGTPKTELPNMKKRKEVAPDSSSKQNT